MTRFALARWFALLFPLLVIGNASAIAIDPCSFTGQSGFSPDHPGHADRIVYNVGTIAARRQLSALPVVFSRATMGSGNHIDIDVIVTGDAASSFPGYQQANPDSYDGRFGVIGPLGVGAYSVTATVSLQDPATGAIQPACGPKAGSLTVFAEPGPTQRALVVEFYNSKLDHYFLTQFEPEISSLDAGTSWKRTGQTFLAYLPRQSDGRGFAVARYYGLPTAGLDAHFFTWNQTERVAVEYGPYSAAWKYEINDAFEVAIPEWPSGMCSTDTVPVYRLWNGRSDSAHRNTTDVSTKQAMIAQGYVPEGYGPDAVAMCALKP